MTMRVLKDSLQYRDKGSHLSNACQASCIVRDSNATENVPRTAQRFPAASPDAAHSGVGTCSEKHSSASPRAVSEDLCWRLVLTVGLTLPMTVGGLLLFMHGFFLLVDDLPYKSTGQNLPFPPLFPHLDPRPLHLNREEGTYFVKSSNESVSVSGSNQPLRDDETFTPLRLESYLEPRIDSASIDAAVCKAPKCNSSWISVTPFNRVVILLIDAMRFDFMLWDPEVDNACKKTETSECLPASLNVRPHYRNRLPLVHDLLRRSDANLQRFLLALLERAEAEGQETVKTQPDEGVDPPTEEQRPDLTDVVNATRLPEGHWGGNRFTRLYIFEADTPTATIQRLTGLATGSMPRFFSVRSRNSKSCEDRKLLPAYSPGLFKGTIKHLFGPWVLEAHPSLPIVKPKNCLNDCFAGP